MKKEIYKQAHENRESQERIKKCYDAFHRQLKEKDGKTKVVVNNRTCWLDNDIFHNLTDSLDRMVKIKDKEFESIGEEDVLIGFTFQEVIARFKRGEEYTQIGEGEFTYIKIYMNEQEGLRIGAYLGEEPLDLPFDTFRLDNLRFKQTKEVKPSKSYRESKFVF